MKSELNSGSEKWKKALLLFALENELYYNLFNGTIDLVLLLKLLFYGCSNLLVYACIIKYDVFQYIDISELSCTT